MEVVELGRAARARTTRQPAAAEDYAQRAGPSAGVRRTAAVVTQATAPAQEQPADQTL